MLSSVLILDSSFTLLIETLLFNQYVLQWITSLMVYIIHLLLKGQGRLSYCEMYIQAAALTSVIMHATVISPLLLASKWMTGRLE